MNLTVNAIIHTDRKYAAGIVARSYGTLNLTDCHSMDYFTGYLNDTESHGGLVGENSGTLTITGCKFTGAFFTKITGSYNNLGCGGFVGKTDEGSSTTIKIRS